MTTNDDHSSAGPPAGGQTTEPPPASRLRRAGAWLGRQTPQTLPGYVIGRVALVITTALTTAVVGKVFGDGSAGPPSAAPSPTASAAAPSCYYATCAHADPEDAGCAKDAVTLADDWQATMHVEIRYSPRCAAVWGKLTGARVDDVITISTSPTRKEKARVRTGQTKYTPMLPAGKTFSVQATGVSADGDPRHGIPAGYELSAGADQDDVGTAPSPARSASP